VNLRLISQIQILFLFGLILSTPNAVAYFPSGTRWFICARDFLRILLSVDACCPLPARLCLSEYFSIRLASFLITAPEPLVLARMITPSPSSGRSITSLENSMVAPPWRTTRPAPLTDPFSTYQPSPFWIFISRSTSRFWTLNISFTEFPSNTLLPSRFPCDRYIRTNLLISPTVLYMEYAGRSRMAGSLTEVLPL